jgi:hypothetical protein
MWTTSPPTALYSSIWKNLLKTLKHLLSYKPMIEVDPIVCTYILV